MTQKRPTYHNLASSDQGQGGEAVFEEVEADETSDSGSKVKNRKQRYSIKPKLTFFFQNGNGVRRIYAWSFIGLFILIFLLIPLIVYLSDGDWIKYLSRFKNLKILFSIISLAFMGVPAAISGYTKKTTFVETMSNADDAGMEHAREKEKQILENVQKYYTQTVPFVLFLFSVIATAVYIIISSLSHSLFSFLLEDENFFGVIVLFLLIFSAILLFAYLQHKILGRKNNIAVVKITLGKYEIKTISRADQAGAIILQ